MESLCKNRKKEEKEFKPSCFGSYKNAMIELRGGNIWKCNCSKCPYIMRCRNEHNQNQNKHY